MENMSDSILLDVRNGFRTLLWNMIMALLSNNGISPYLRRQVREYFSERWATADMERGLLCFQIYGGVPQD